MKPQKILIVDDDVNLMGAMQQILQRCNYDAFSCDRGEKALDRLGQEVFDILITDFHMPEMDGLELIRELLGPHVSDMQVRFCEISIINQCINPMVVGKRHKERRGDKDSPPGVDDIEAYSKHVVEFSLAGIRAIRYEAEKKRRGLKK